MEIYSIKEECPKDMQNYVQSQNLKKKLLLKEIWFSSQNVRCQVKNEPTVSDLLAGDKVAKRQISSGI